MINFINSAPAELNLRQRWSSYLTIMVALASLGAGWLLRNQNLNSTYRYENQTVGIIARYPANWLLEESLEPTKADFVFRVQDAAALPFKTTLQVSLLIVGPGAYPADLPDLLNMTRASSFSAYRPLEIAQITLPDGSSGIQMHYAYVSSETNQFLQSVPVVVEALDVISVKKNSNQAVVITYRADSQSFEANRHYFDSFLKSLEF